MSSLLKQGKGKGVSHMGMIMMVYMYICACLLRSFFANFGISMGGFSSQRKALNSHPLGVF